MVIIRMNGYPRFPLAWTKNPLEITGYNFEYLTLDEMEVVLLLDVFEVMSSHIMIILDQVDDNDMNKYMSMFDIVTTLIWDFFLVRLLIFVLPYFCRDNVKNALGQKEGASGHEKHRAPRNKKSLEWPRRLDHERNQETS